MKVNEKLQQALHDGSFAAVTCLTRFLTRLIFVLFVVMLVSCSVRKAGGHIQMEDGYAYYVNSLPAMRIQLYGDYFFHPLNRKYLPEVPQTFLKYVASTGVISQPELLFAAHTTVPPYYSAVGIVYPQGEADTLRIAGLKDDMKKYLRTSFNTADTFETAYGTATCFNYQVFNPVTKLRSVHRECFVRNKQATLRFFFWTTTGDTAMVFRETQTILVNITR